MLKVNRVLSLALIIGFGLQSAGSADMISERKKSAVMPASIDGNESTLSDTIARADLLYNRIPLTADLNELSSSAKPGVSGSLPLAQPLSVTKSMVSEDPAVLPVQSAPGIQTTPPAAQTQNTEADLKNIQVLAEPSGVSPEGAAVQPPKGIDVPAAESSAGSPALGGEEPDPTVAENTPVYTEESTFEVEGLVPDPVIEDGTMSLSGEAALATEPPDTLIAENNGSTSTRTVVSPSSATKLNALSPNPALLDIGPGITDASINQDFVNVLLDADGSGKVGVDDVNFFLGETMMAYLSLRNRLAQRQITGAAAMTELIILGERTAMRLMDYRRAKIIPAPAGSGISENLITGINALHNEILFGMIYGDRPTTPPPPLDPPVIANG